MFKWIKMWLGIDEPKKPEPKKELPADFVAVAPFVDVMAPGLVKKPVENKKVADPMDPVAMMNTLAGKKKKPATKKAAPKKAAKKAK